MRYPLAADPIPQADLDALADWLRSSPWLTMGSLCRRFEEEFAAWLGRRHAVFVNSGSSANLLMWAVAKALRQGRWVTAPAAAWSTTVSPALQLGFQVKLRDVGADTWGLDGRQAFGIAVHMLGVPCGAWGHPEDAYLEDACAALGSVHADGKKVGTRGWLSSFSFFANHQMTCVEGGAVVTDDDQAADVLRLLRAHGWGKDLGEREGAWWARHGQGIPDFQRRFTFYLPGFNLRPTEMQAFLALRQLARLEERSARRAELWARYWRNLRGQPGLTIQRPLEGDRVAAIALGVLAESGGHRERIAAALDAAGIETRPIGGGNLARQPFWDARTDAISRQGIMALYPVADQIHWRGFQLPLHPGMGENDVDVICEVVLGVKP